MTTQDKAAPQVRKSTVGEMEMQPGWVSPGLVLTRAAHWPQMQQNEMLRHGTPKTFTTKVEG